MVVCSEPRIVLAFKHAGVSFTQCFAATASWSTRAAICVACFFRPRSQDGFALNSPLGRHLETIRLPEPSSESFF
ncbi:MAG: hypothetical protein EA378_03210 [Phycisphaerales bacterium]|nr:MAG: hypothetical protein EA378_03210 [Phycisphaerales bacterium]